MKSTEMYMYLLGIFLSFYLKKTELGQEDIIKRLQTM